MITLYHSPRSRSSRMIWLLEELGVPYEIRQVSIFRPMSGEGVPDPANVHPDKRVPAIVHNGEMVAESVAITLYLTDAFPEAGLGPVAGEAGRGAYLTWLAWYAAEMEPAMFAAMGDELDGNPMKRRNHDAMIARLEGALATGPYLMGESFTGADLLISSAISFARQAFPESAVLDAYAERCKARPAMLRAIPLDETEGVREAA
jgi:glutathione S-transferase